MELVWNAVGVPGVLALAFAWSMAAFVYASAPARAANRFLALVLLLEGAAQVRTGVLYFFAEARDAYAVAAVHVTVQLVLPSAYLAVLGTLDSPFSRALRSRAGRVALAAPALAGLALWAARPDLFVHDVRAVEYARWEAWNGPALGALYAWSALAYVVALVGTIAAFRAAPAGTVARERAKAFAIAFGVRDGAFVLLLGSYPILIAAGVLARVAPAFVAATALGTVAFVALLAYGVLRSQLFDLDLKVKWTVKQSTVAGAFVAVFFVVSETAQLVFQTEWGPYAGIAATALLVFALAPLQRVADRVADAAMPTVAATPEYLTFKKLEVYREAVESVIQDGSVTPKERAMLDRLRARLGLSPGDAAALEDDVRGLARRAQAAPAA